MAAFPTVAVQDGAYYVQLATAGESAFRISVQFPPSPALEMTTHSTTPSFFSPLPGTNEMVSPRREDANFTLSTRGADVTVLSTTFGRVEINSTTGEFSMLSSRSDDDVVVVGSGAGVSLASLLNDSLGDDVCLSAQHGFDQSGGVRVPGFPDGLAAETQNNCCTACNSDVNCTAFVFDPDGADGETDCWLMQDVQSSVISPTRVFGGATAACGADGCVTLNLGGVTTDTTRYYGAGGGKDTVLNGFNSTSASPHVANTDWTVPSFWSSDGYTALTVSPFVEDPDAASVYPARWSAEARDLSWTVRGTAVDLYLAPSATHLEGLRVLHELTGPPAVLPRFAFGFLACRWGWTNDTYILDTLEAFRDGAFPIDAFISDFEWFTAEPDYSLPDEGSPSYRDFDYNNVTFPSPAAQLKQYREQLNLRFGGIRKPRLGNSDNLNAARDAGWLVSSYDPSVSGAARDMNFTIAEVKQYYSENHAHFLDDGVEFWWNDEGETFYFMYYHWNEAQLAGLREYDATKRFFTINRAFTPGLSRTGAIVWTGDISVDWESLQRTPGYVLNWGLAGATYVTCDIGGFSGGDTPALLLVRWYWAGVFIPVMRVHSSLGNTPHFPFLYGDEAGDACRKALDLRYRLIPLLYSLGHAAHDTGAPVARPLLLHYPDDYLAADLTSQWLVGDSLLVAPVLSEDNSTSVYLPVAGAATLWYEFNSTVTHDGGTTLSFDGVALDTAPVFAPAGAVVPLAPPGLQYTDALPGGPLEVQIYAGADGAFTLVEDDGETTDYDDESDDGVRRTAFIWDDASLTLSWTVSGGYRGDAVFEELFATMFVGGAAAGSASSTYDLSSAGNIVF